MFSLAARSSRSRSMPWVRSTFTRRTGRTTVNLLLKYLEISSPRDAISAISSALGIFLYVFGIALLFLLGGLPRGNGVMDLPLRVVPDFEDHRAKVTAAPSDCAKLFRIIVLLVDEVGLIENLLRFLETDAVFLFDGPTLFPVKPEPRRHV